MIRKYSIKYLSDYFAYKYPESEYPEFEHKINRPYVVLLLKIDGHTFAIPFRTNMNHKYGYKFIHSGRDTKTCTGLDFTKVVLVDDEKLLGDDAIIDNKEYLELSKKHYFIRKKFIRYYDNYKKYLNGELNEYYQSKPYIFSTLNYYKKELGLK